MTVRVTFNGIGQDKDIAATVPADLTLASLCQLAIEQGASVVHSPSRKTDTLIMLVEI